MTTHTQVTPTKRPMGRPPVEDPGVARSFRMLAAHLEWLEAYRRAHGLRSIAAAHRDVIERAVRLEPKP